MQFWVSINLLPAPCSKCASRKFPWVRTIGIRMCASRVGQKASTAARSQWSGSQGGWEWLSARSTMLPALAEERRFRRAAWPRNSQGITVEVSCKYWATTSSSDSNGHDRARFGRSISVSKVYDSFYSYLCECIKKDVSALTASLLENHTTPQFMKIKSVRTTDISLPQVHSAIEQTGNLFLHHQHRLYKFPWLSLAIDTLKSTGIPIYCPDST